MRVNTVEEAWREADKLFPTDYIENPMMSRLAGHSIYTSTVEDVKYSNYWISDLQARLEVNLGVTTINIWIENNENADKISRALELFKNELV